TDVGGVAGHLLSPCRLCHDADMAREEHGPGKSRPSHHADPAREDRSPTALPFSSHGRVHSMPNSFRLRTFPRANLLLRPVPHVLDDVAAPPEVDADFYERVHVDPG